MEYGDEKGFTWIYEWLTVHGFDMVFWYFIRLARKCPQAAVQLRKWRLRPLLATGGGATMVWFGFLVFILKIFFDFFWVKVSCIRFWNCSNSLGYLWRSCLWISFARVCPWIVHKCPPLCRAESPHHSRVASFILRPEYLQEVADRGCFRCCALPAKKSSYALNIFEYFIFFIVFLYIFVFLKQPTLFFLKCWTLEIVLRCSSMIWIVFIVVILLNFNPQKADFPPL